MHPTTYKNQSSQNSWLLFEFLDVFGERELYESIDLLMMQEKQGMRDLTSELSKIAYQEESGRTTKKMINHAISWL